MSPEARREKKATALAEVKEEVDSSAELAAPVAPARGSSAPAASRDEGRRRPRSPPGPPPARESRWVGPILAPERRGAEERGEGRHWPKSKGVKRREKNRAFREANYGRGWGHQGGGGHRR